MSERSLPRVASRLFNAPLMLAPTEFQTALMGVGDRVLGRGPALLAEDGFRPSAAAVVQDGIAVVPVLGEMVARSSFLDAQSGLTSYRAIGESLEAAMLDPAVRGVVMEIDSAGGEVAGLFDLVDRVAALKKAGRKPLYAVASDAALSAAYMLAATADRLYVTQMGLVGSVGVVAAHVDESALDAKLGRNWTFVYAGAHKVDGNPHLPLSDEAAADLQADVDRVYDTFVASVAKARGIRAKAARDTQARVYRGKEALSAGLADAIGTLEKALKDLSAEATQAPSGRARMAVRGTTILHPSAGATMARKKEQAQDSAQDEIDRTDPAGDQEAIPGEIISETMDEGDKPLQQPHPTEPADAVINPADERSPGAGGTDQEEAPTRPAVPGVPGGADWYERNARAEAAALMEIADQAKRLGLTVDPHKAFAKGVRPDALRAAVLRAAADRAEAQTIATVAAIAPAREAGDRAERGSALLRHIDTTYRN